MTDRGYRRISLDTRESGSIGKQTARIEPHVQGDVEWYEDRSVSGAKVPFAERPDGGRLLRDLRAGDRVLVTKIDRAARNVKDLLNLVQAIEDKGASIVFVDQSIDTSGPMGRFLLVLLGAIAELEANIVAERRKESLEVFRQEGRKASGGTPFGFKTVPNPEGRGLVLRPDYDVHVPFLMSPAESLREGIKEVLAGVPQRRLAERFGLHYTTISDLLRNPRLAGMTPHGDGVVMLPTGTPLIDSAAALLSMGEWMELQDFLNANASSRKKPTAMHVGYGAALSCSGCRARMYRSTQKNRRASYTCTKSNHVGELRNVPGVSVVVDDANDYIEKVFLDRFGDMPVVTSRRVHSDAERMTAIATAQVSVDEALRRMTNAAREDQTKAFKEWQDAKDRLEEAERLPDTMTTVAAYAGMTVRERWESSDDPERCNMLEMAGKWVVHGGIKPIEEKVVLEPDELMIELRTHAIGEGPDAPKGFIIAQSEGKSRRN